METVGFAFLCVSRVQTVKGSEQTSEDGEQVFRSENLLGLKDGGGRSLE